MAAAQALLQSGAKLSVVADEGITVFHLAAKHASKKMATLLLEYAFCRLDQAARRSCHQSFFAGHIVSTRLLSPGVYSCLTYALASCLLSPFVSPHLHLCRLPLVVSHTDMHRPRKSKQLWCSLMNMGGLLYILRGTCVCVCVCAARVFKARCRCICCLLSTDMPMDAPAGSASSVALPRIHHAGRLLIPMVLCTAGEATLMHWMCLSKHQRISTLRTLRE